MWSLFIELEKFSERINRISSVLEVEVFIVCIPSCLEAMGLRVLLPISCPRRRSGITKRGFGFVKS